MEKELLDKTLEIIELNNRKKELLNLMSDLDFVDRTNTEDYYNYIDLYKRTCSSYNNKIEVLNENDKYNIEHYILGLNPVFNKQIPFSHILASSDDKYIAFKRMFVDFGSKLLLLYVNKTQSSLENVFHMLGLNISVDTVQTDIDNDYVNECMIADFTNVLYTEISKLLDCKLSYENKDLLMRLKYNMMFISPAVERRAIMTEFDIPKTPHLVDKNTIYETGLSYHEYTAELDNIMTKWLEGLINSCLYYSSFTDNPIDLLNLVFIKAFGSTLEDTEILDCLKADYNNVNSNNYINAVNLINEALEQSKVESMKNKELRQYSRI